MGVSFRCERSPPGAEDHQNGPGRFPVMLRNLWGRVRQIFSPTMAEEEIREYLEKLRKEAPIPVFWMVGKTQSGKTSVILYLTGADRAEIGKGFQPCKIGR